MKSKAKGKYWFYFGLTGYLIVAFSSIFRSYEPDSLYNNAYMAIDWLSATAIYFFLIAIIGRLFDLKKQKKHPMWLYLISALWLISSLSALIFASNEKMNFWLIAFFPFVFGVFFTGFAFLTIFPKLITEIIYFKLILDILFLGVFYSWIYLEYKEKFQKLRSALLYLMFIVFFLGLSGCIRSLA